MAPTGRMDSLGGRGLHITARRACFAIIATLLLLVAPSLYAATPRTLVAKVERVSEEDTIIAVTTNQIKLRIRILGIDAPEVPHGTKPANAPTQFNRLIPALAPNILQHDTAHGKRGCEPCITSHD